ncbi:amino acid kinase family protein [Couchioplanes azureus]|uniref:amino acid kinase family protein n=1 Tax=Couchioplanes caeruleus TaxID=56438 RepID=UPI00166F9009|nr:aspartate kinase [Couchioplanes caeruleus]GGQ69819.1 hypothetical protein GCM10010166_44560 [Couchioplanes caeruleus subsp. azureus]
MSDVRVMKFGGSSFASPGHFERVAGYVADRVRAGDKVVVVTSGMPGSTEGLRQQAMTVNAEASGAALLGLLPLADAIGAALLRTALERTGLGVELLHPHRSGLVSTVGRGQAATLTGVDPAPIRGHLAGGDAVVLAGGQAVDPHGRPTWLGKNSSDLSAVAIAVALGLDSCDIHSDVNGVYDADPNQVSGARLIPRLRYDDVLTMARSGAKVLHAGAVRHAADGGVRIVCRLNSGAFDAGSVIGADGPPVDAVVADERSVVAVFATDADAERAYGRLEAEGATVHRFTATHRPTLVVTGAYFDVAGLLRAGGHAAEITGERLVTVVRAGQPQRRLVAAADLVPTARSAHAELVALGSSGPARSDLMPAGR